MTATAPQKRRDFFILGVLLTILFIYSTVRFGVSVTRGKGFIPTDFSVNVRAVERWEGGLTPYVETDSSPFKYSPAFLWVFQESFARLPGASAWLAYCGVSLFAWCMSLFLWSIWLRDWFATSRMFWGAFVIGGVASWHGFLEHLSYGQADFFIASFTTWGYWLLQKRKKYSAKRDLLAATFFASALLIKPTALLLLLGLILFGAWHILALTGLMSVALLGVSFAGLSGFSRGLFLLRAWLTSLGKQPWELFGGNLNQSVGAAYARLMNHREWAASFSKTLFLLGFTLLIGISLKKIFFTSTSGSKKPTQPLPLLAALSWAFYLCFTPLSWRWLTFMWWPLFMVAAALVLKQKRTLPKGLLLLFVLIATLLQAIVAHALGISEVDTLSQYSLYAWGSAFLLGIFYILVKV